ncbi:hypothetical protein OBK14_10660 [Empedobacter falsenii]
MSFQQDSNGFGNKASKNLNKDFSKKAEENINALKDKGKQIASENEQTIKTAKKTAIGCSIATVLIGIVSIVIFIYILYKIFS